MSWGVTTEPHSVNTTPAPASVAERATDPFARSSREDGWLVVEPGPPGPAVRGRLALFIEGAIERTLEGVGAPPPGTGASSNMAVSLEDQLYRARCAQAGGIAVCFDTLGGIASLTGALDSDDSAALRWWLKMSRRGDVRLKFAAADALLRIYEEPTTLSALLTATQSGELADGPAPTAAPELAASVAAMDLSELPPLVGFDAAESSQGTLDEDEDEDGNPSFAVHVDPDEDAHRSAALLSEAARSMAAELDDEDSDWLRETLMCLSTPPPTRRNERRPAPIEFVSIETVEDPAEGDAASDATGQDAPTRARTDAFCPHPSMPAPEPEPASDETLDATLDAEPEPEPAAGGASAAPGDTGEPTRAAPEPIEPSRPAVALDALGRAAALVTSPPAANAPDGDSLATECEAAPAADCTAEEWAVRCEAWRHELQSAHGPKPLAVVERQFVSAFIHLRDAMDRGFGSDRDRSALDEWATSFERSYAEAFNALKVRGKRPMMVLDIPDIAMRLARLHGARTVQLLLVDGMRFDLGMRVHDALKELNRNVAACAERLILWSALPSTTSTQVELIGRGPLGLRDFTGEVDDEMLVSRGRKANTIRRLRTGQREVLKLDLAEARFSEPGGPTPARLDAVGAEIAERLASHFEGVPDRTLVMVFGDHGFVLDPREGGTAAARQGGASPEEVLVPAFAWVVGSVH